MHLKRILIPLQALHHYEEYEDHRTRYSVPTIRFSPLVDQCMRLDCERMESMAVLCMGIICGDGK